MKEFLGETIIVDYPEKQYTYKEGFEGFDLEYQEYTNEKNKNIIYVKNDYMSYQKVQQYFKEIAQKFNEIQLDGRKLSGMPLIQNTRIPVSLVLACLRDDMTIQEISNEYNLSNDDIQNAIEYVIQILDTPYQDELL